MRPPRTNTKKKDVLFVLADWNAKLRSQDIPGVIGKFGLGVQNEARQRLTEFWQENMLVVANTLFQQPKELILLNCGVEDSGESLGLQGDQVKPVSPKGNQS